MDGGAMNRRTMMTTLAGGVVAVGYAGRASLVADPFVRTLVGFGRGVRFRRLRAAGRAAPKLRGCHHDADDYPRDHDHGAAEDSKPGPQSHALGRFRRRGPLAWFVVPLARRRLADNGQHRDRDLPVIGRR